MQDSSTGSGNKSRISTPKKVALAVLGALTILTFANMIQAAVEKYGDRVNKEEFAFHIRDHVIVHKRDRHTVRVEVNSESPEVMIDESYDIAAGGLLSIAVGDADVRVNTHAADQATIQVQLDGRDMEKAREYYADQNFEVTREGSTIFLRTRPNQRNYSWDSAGGARITVDATIPEVFNAEIKTSDGDVDLKHLEGRVVLQTSDGDITTETLKGPSIALKTSDGDVRTLALDAENVSISTSDGDIIMDNIQSNDLAIRTSDGDIHVKDIRGKSAISTSDGDIRIVSAEGQELAIRTSDGEVVADQLSADHTQIQTSDGDISLGRVSGALTAKTSGGDINVALLNPGNVSLRASDGSIHIKVPGQFAANLFLKGERVRLSSGFRFDGELKDNQADGRINGGGPTLEARTSGGEVVFREN